MSRRVWLPLVILDKISDGSFGGFGGSEKYLEKYMIPKHNGCFIDAGASRGMWTFFVAKQGCTVHAFEPSPQPYQRLKRRAVSYPNVYPYPYALGDSNCEAKFNLHKFSGNDSLASKDEDFSGFQITVKVKTIDSHNFRDVGLIKIDTEGYELPILLGARRTIINNKPRLIIEVHAPYKQQIEKITALLNELGYCWVIKHKQWSSQPQIIADCRRQ